MAERGENDPTTPIGANLGRDTQPAGTPPSRHTPEQEDDTMRIRETHARRVPPITSEHVQRSKRKPWWRRLKFF